MAMAISDWREIPFQRNNFYRLLKGTLRDGPINIIVDWLEAFHVPDIREKLKPDSIFREVGKSARDYYFHLPDGNLLDEWDEQILEEFDGIYWCAPAEDKNSYTPLPLLRKWFADRKSCPELAEKGRSLDIKQYISERSILILQHTLGSYFYAAEFPLSLLFPRHFVHLDLRMVYEGIGVVSANSIHVMLRECLSRVPKSHSIVISEKTETLRQAPFALSLFVGGGFRSDVVREWQNLTEADREHLRREYESSIDADHWLSGPAQISVSPLPQLRNRVSMSFARECVYHRKPRDFLRNKELHLIRHDLNISNEIEKILANPLTVGELL